MNHFQTGRGPCPRLFLFLASVKSRLVLPFWYRLTRVVPDKEPLNGCACVSRPISCYLAQMWSRPIPFLWLWPATDHEPHCQHMPINNIWRRAESTPQSGWWRSHTARIYSNCSTREINNQSLSTGSVTKKWNTVITDCWVITRSHILHTIFTRDKQQLLQINPCDDDQCDKLWWLTVPSIVNLVDRRWFSL